MKVSESTLEAFSGVSEGRAGAAATLLIGLRSGAADELAYSIRRLVRGCASEKRVARESFFSTLAALFAAEPASRLAETLDVVDEELKLAGQTKTELAEICTGRVLVCGAALRSGLFLRCTSEDRARVITTLFAAGDRKSYLGLTAYFLIADFMINHTEEETSTYLWPLLRDRLTESYKELSLDSLYCMLVLRERCPTIWKDFSKVLFGSSSLFAEPAASIISEKLMNVPEFSYVNHPVYEACGKAIADSEHLVSFWKEGLESKLNFKNENRVLVILTILDAILRNIGENYAKIPSLLGDRFIPCVLEWFRGFQSAHQNGRASKFKGKQKDYVHESKGKQIMIQAKRAFDVLVEALKKEGSESKTRLEVLEKLLFFPGDIMFCDITNSKIIKILIEDLNFDCVQQFAIVLKAVITNESKKKQILSNERSWTNSERLRAAEMLTYLINHKTSVDNVKWRIKNMQLLIEISLFKTAGSDSSFVSSELAVAVRKSFFRCLTFRLPKLETLLKILNSLVKFIDRKVSDETVVKNNVKCFRADILKSWRSMIDFVAKLENSRSDENSKAHAVFQILALHCGLLLFSDVMDSETSQNSLQEVQSCYEHYVKGEQSHIEKNKSNRDGEIVEDEPEWTEVLVDVFLGFLSRDSSLLRNIVQVVFRLLCEYLTPSAIGQILTVLDPDEETDLLAYREIGNENVSEKSENSDEESHHSAEGEDELSEDSESNDEGEDDDNANVNDQLRMAVQKALGTAAPETDTESVDIENMDEDEGKRIDHALSTAFRMLRQSKGEMSKKEKKNHKILMEFRIRVIDLLHIYLEKMPSMEICIAMITPLFKCLEFAIKDSTQKPLEDKVRKCLKYLTSIKNFSSVDGVSLEVLSDYLNTVINRGDKTQFVFQALGDVISKCGVFLVKCSQKLSGLKTPNKKKKKLSSENSIVNIYHDALEAFFTKRDCLLPVIFFHEVLQTNWEGNWVLLNTIIDKTFDNSVRQFKRNEGLEMINAFYISLKRSTKSDFECDLDKLNTFEKHFSEVFIHNLDVSNQNVSAVSERFFTLLTKTLMVIKNYHVFKKSDDKIDWKSIAPAIQSIRKNLKIKNLQEYFKFCNLFGLEKLKNVAVEKNPKKESVDSGHESETEEDLENNKSNLMNGKEKSDIKLENKFEKSTTKRPKEGVSKKEAKHLRLMASSEGLQNVSFSTLPAPKETEEESTKSSKKRKASVIKEKSKKIKNDV